MMENSVTTTPQSQSSFFSGSAVIYVKPYDCVSMKEMLRDFYDRGNFTYLYNVINRDGYKPAYPLRALENNDLKKYEVFDGIHRLEVAQKLNLPFIPISVERLTRSEAVAQGFKANRTHAWYNTIDKARHFHALYLLVASQEKNRQNVLPLSEKGGRGVESPIHRVAELTGENEETIKNHLRLLSLPYDVQNFIGNGKLSYTIGLLLLTLKNPQLISQTAKRAVKEGWSFRFAKTQIAIIKHSIKHDFKACDVCGKGFEKDKISKIDLCPKCMGRVREIIRNTRDK